MAQSELIFAGAGRRIPSDSRRGLREAWLIAKSILAGNWYSSFRMGVLTMREIRRSQQAATNPPRRAKSGGSNLIRRARGLVATLQTPHKPTPFDRTGDVDRGRGCIAASQGWHAWRPVRGESSSTPPRILLAWLSKRVSEINYYLLAWKPDPERRRAEVHGFSKLRWLADRIFLQVRRGFFDADFQPQFQHRERGRKAGWQRYFAVRITK